MSKWNAVIKDLDDNRDKVVMGKMSIEEWDKYVQGLLLRKHTGKF